MEKQDEIDVIDVLEKTHELIKKHFTKWSTNISLNSHQDFWSDICKLVHESALLQKSLEVAHGQNA